MPARLVPAHRTLGLALLALAGALVAIELGRPFRTAAIAFDSEVAVLHFQRIVSGQHLETFVPTTPKPLLTIIYGPLFALFGDWRPIAWATIGAYVTGIVLTARLADRIAGPLAGASAGVAVMIAPTLLFDVGESLATPWALILWLTAGLAVTAREPRWALAGVCLGLATLARLETFVATGAALLAVSWGTFAPVRLVPGGRPARAAWLVPAVALLAIPIMLIHDWLLTGDPLFWTTVAAGYTEQTALHVLTPPETLELIVGRYLAQGGLLVLATIGIVRTWRSGSRSLTVGLLAFGPGIAAFLVLLAIRGLFVSERYLAAIDLSLAVAAGIGLGVLVDVVRRGLAASTWRGPGLAAGATAAALTMLVVAGPYWIRDPDLRLAVHRASRLALDADRVVPELRAIAMDLPQVAGDRPIVLVPVPVWPRIAAMTGLSLRQVGRTDPAAVDVRDGYPTRGQIILHSRSGDPPAAGFADLETEGERTIGDVTVVPVIADRNRGLWLVRIR